MRKTVMLRLVISMLIFAAISNIRTIVAEEVETIAVYEDRIGNFALTAEIAIDPYLRRVYVTCKGSDNVAVIYEDSNSIVGAINVGRSPYGIAVSSESSRIYVCNQADNTVSIIDGKTLAIISDIEVGMSPKEVAIDLKRDLIYIVNNGNNSVSVSLPHCSVPQ